MEHIQSTKDYELFRKLEGNRPLVQRHLKKLLKSISNDNRLSLHPIIINGRNEVVDGQHRLECAKRLDLPIFFIKSETVGEQHFIDCNVNQRSFEVDNFIDFFSEKEKNVEYILLKNMLKETSLKLKALLTLIFGIMSKNVLEFIKTGRFKFPQNNDSKVLIENYKKFMVYAQDKRIRPSSMFTNQLFTKSFRWLCLTDGFDWGTFARKLDLRWFDLKPQRTSEEWYSLLVNIYNFKNHVKLNGQEF